ncbi:MAG: phosphate regulon sensor histidine kinase PhoR [Pseudomonadota bacterium]
MLPFSRASLLLTVSLFGAAALAASVFGHWGWWLFGASVLTQLRTTSEILQLFRWAQNPFRRPNQTDRVWQNTALALHRRVRRERQRFRDTLGQLRGLRAITRSLPDAAITINGRDEIETFNPAAAQLLRLKPSDVGASLPALIRHPDFVALLKGQATDDSIEIMSPFEDDQRLEVRSLTVSPDRNLVVVRDVTQLTTLLTMRQDFIANVSHELRTPLTVVKGYLEALGDGDMDPETLRTVIDRLHSPTRRMQALVDDLLLLTRLESSPDISEKEREAIDMRRVLENVRREVQVLLQDHQQLKVKYLLDSALFGIEAEIYSAALNLVTNALRYSPDGGVITVYWRPQTDASERTLGAELCVEDQGVGIAPEHISRITERFYRVDLASARIRGGTGLGLAIVKHVLIRHGATLEVESEIGMGSRFRCCFPEAVLSQVIEPELRTVS